MLQLVTSKQAAQFTVNELALSIKHSLEANYDNIELIGEIESLKVYASGHAYLTLKDESAIINAVCWQRDYLKNQEALQVGYNVVCVGNVTAYPKRSSYQFIIKQVSRDKLGLLLQQMQALRARLTQEGLFAQLHKKQLPRLPAKVAIITSKDGAVIHDMLHVLEHHKLPVEVLVFASTVQGDKAASALTKMLKAAEASQVDTIIIARGGGSMQDLQAFNDEELVRAVFNCSIPIISAVGHQTDFTLLDEVADLRCPTPTAAAHAVILNHEDFTNATSRLLTTCYILLQERLKLLHQELQLSSRALQETKNFLSNIITSQSLQVNTQHALHLKHTQLLNLSITNPRPMLENAYLVINNFRIRERLEAYLQAHSYNLNLYKNTLEQFLPQNILDKGYVLLTNEENTLIDSVEGLRMAETVTVHFKSGTARIKITIL